MQIPFKKDPIEFDQRVLFPTNIFDLLPEEHDCYIYEEIFKQLDTRSVENTYCVKGQNAYHPRLIVGILIYSYSQGIFSSRQIEKRCHEDIGFMYISRKNCPNFRVLSDFRKDNHEFFKECFKQSVLIAMGIGMASLGHVSLDGSKFKADTSKHKAMSYGRLKKKEQELTEEIKDLLKKAAECDREEDAEYCNKSGYEIPEELKFKESRLAKIKAAKEALEKREHGLNPDAAVIEDKKQISFADKEACIMGKKGDFRYSYNGQISVDKDSQIIVGQHLTQSANDKQEVTEALQEIKETTGKNPDIMSLDNGYMSGSNLDSLSKTDIDVYMATGKGEKKDFSSLDESNRDIKKSDFTYDTDKDCFICPACNILKLRSKSGSEKKVYQAHSNDCNNCIYRNRCCKSKKGEPRIVTTDDKEYLRQEMVDKMEHESSKEIYKERKTIVEPVFGQIKKNLGFKEFSIRGFIKTSGEFSLVCAVHNIKKIASSIKSGRIYFIKGNLVPVNN